MTRNDDINLINNFVTSVSFIGTLTNIHVNKYISFVAYMLTDGIVGELINIYIEMYYP